MHTKARRIATALLATTALGIGAIELDANLAARAGLRQALASHPGLSVASVFAEPLTSHVFLRGVHLNSGATQVSVGALDLPMGSRGFSLVGAAQASPFDDKSDEAKPDEGGAEAPAEPHAGGGPTAEPAPAQAPATTAAVPGTTTADNVVITRGATTYRIKHVELAGSPLSNADLATILDPKSSEPIEARLRRLTATAVTVPEVEIDNTSGGAEGHLVFSRIVLAGATAGKVVSATVDSTMFKQKATDADPEGKKDLEWGTGPVVATGIDFAQIVRLFEATRTNDAEPVLPLFDSVTVTNFKTQAKDGKVFTIAAMKETGAKGRALKAGTLPKGDEPNLTDAEKAARYADLVQSLAIGSIELQDMSGGDADGKFSLTNVAMKDFTGGKLGGFTVGALTVDAPKAKVSIGSIQIGPITLPPPSAIEKGSNGSPSSMITADVKIAVDKVAYDVDMADAAKNEASKRVTFNLGHLELVSLGKSGELPSSSTMAVNNLTFDVPPNDSSKALLDMGYRHVDVSLNASTVYDADGQTLLIKDFSVQGVDMGSLALSIGLINVTKGVTSPDPEVAKGSALAILVKSIALDLVNKGLAEKALARQAAADGISVDKERANLVDFFAVKLPASVNNNANAKLIGSAVAKFVAEPKTLHVSIVSKSGLGAASMGMLGDPGLLLDSLDVKATANQ